MSAFPFDFLPRLRPAAWEGWLRAGGWPSPSALHRAFFGRLLVVRSLLYIYKMSRWMGSSSSFSFFSPSANVVCLPWDLNCAPSDTTGKCLFHGYGLNCAPSDTTGKCLFHGYPSVPGLRPSSSACGLRLRPLPFMPLRQAAGRPKRPSTPLCALRPFYNCCCGVYGS